MGVSGAAWPGVASARACIDWPLGTNTRAIATAKQATYSGREDSLRYVRCVIFTVITSSKELPVISEASLRVLFAYRWITLSAADLGGLATHKTRGPHRR